MTKPGDWMKSPVWLANIGHFLAGYAVILTACVFARTVEPLLVTQGIFTLIVLAKEYIIDLAEESGETVLSSTIDALGYFIGNIAGWAVLFASGRITIFHV